MRLKGFNILDLDCYEYDNLKQKMENMCLYILNGAYGILYIYKEEDELKILNTINKYFLISLQPIDIFYNLDDLISKYNRHDFIINYCGIQFWIDWEDLWGYVFKTLKENTTLENNLVKDKHTFKSIWKSLIKDALKTCLIDKIKQVNDTTQKQIHMYKDKKTVLENLHNSIKIAENLYNDITIENIDNYIKYI